MDDRLYISCEPVMLLRGLYYDCRSLHEMLIEATVADCQMLIANDYLSLYGSQSLGGLRRMKGPRIKAY